MDKFVDNIIFFYLIGIPLYIFITLMGNTWGFILFIATNLKRFICDPLLILKAYYNKTIDILFLICFSLYHGVKSYSGLNLVMAGYRAAQHRNHIVWMEIFRAEDQGIYKDFDELMESTPLLQKKDRQYIDSITSEIGISDDEAEKLVYMGSDFYMEYCYDV